MGRSVFTKRVIILWLTILALGICTYGQDDDICREFGESPSREIGRDNRLVPYVFGRVILSGFSAQMKRPRVTVIYSDSLQPATRQVISRSGNYCFAKRGNGGVLAVEVDGVETIRKPVSDISVKSQREDFEILPPRSAQGPPPGVVSAKPARPANEKTVALYEKVQEADADEKPDRAILIVRQIVAIDPDDFVAWSMLGSLLIRKNSIADAEAAFTRSLELKPDYTPSILSLGMLAAVQSNFEKAISYFGRATLADPMSARAYRLLGEAYLQNRQGNLGIAALDKALELDPIGMAECHLSIARLFDLAGAKKQAAAEYKAFLEKVPDHPDKKKFEKYIKDNQ